MSLIKFNDYLLNESNSEMNILDSIEHVLKLEQKPLSMIEIWSKICELNLLPKSQIDKINSAKKGGKEVGVYSGYLDTLLSRSSVNTKRSDKNNKNLFVISGTRPNVKYYLNELSDEKVISDRKMTFVEAAQLILKQNDNEPMSSHEIWDKIEEQDLVDTKGSTPWMTLNAQMLSYSDNTNISRKKKNKIFTIVAENPAMFILIDADSEVQPVPDEENKYYLLGAYDKNNPEISKQYIDGGYWLNGFAVAGLDTLKEKVNEIPVGAKVAIKSSYVKSKVNPVILIKARGIVTKNYNDGTRIDVDWEKDFKPFEIMRNDVGAYRQTLHDISNKEEHINLIWNKEDDEMEDFELKPFGKFPQPFDVESELSKAQAQAQAQSDDVKFFKNFRAVQAEEEIEDFYDYVKNPFMQAICVLGKSGAGKSTTIDNILQKSGHNYQFIIPSASTTGLLSQFSPSDNSYIPSRLGRMIELAYKNKDKMYTAVFDECHKTNIIEMINDELLQAISVNRNKGVRFISLDDDTRRLYPSAKEDNRGNILIPNNFGFIFISSNARVISGNPDFFNRVDLVELTKSQRSLQTVDDLNSLRKTESDDKRELVDKIVSVSE